MLFPMVYGLIGVGIWQFCVKGGYSYFWGSYTKDFYTIGESILYFPILGFVNILEVLVVHEISRSVKTQSSKTDWIVYI